MAKLETYIMSKPTNRNVIDLSATRRKYKPTINTFIGRWGSFDAPRARQTTKNLYKLFSDNQVNVRDVRVVENSEGVLRVDLTVSGDWKHDHLATEKLMEQQGFTLLDKQVTEDSDGDWYEAVHKYVEDKELIRFYKQMKSMKESGDMQPKMSYKSFVTKKVSEDEQEDFKEWVADEKQIYFDDDASKKMPLSYWLDIKDEFDEEMKARKEDLNESEDEDIPFYGEDYSNFIGLYRCTHQISHPNMGVLIRKGREVEVRRNDNGTINAGGINLDPSFLDTHFEPVETESDVEHDMGEMYGVPHGASPDYALKFFESKKRKISESRDTIEDIVMNYSSWSGTNGINDATDSAAYDLSLVGYTFNEVKAYFDADGYYPDGCWDEEFANLILQKLRKLERNRTLESKKRPNKKSIKEDYTPDLLDDLVSQYESEYSAETHSDIWDEILNKYHDEELANDVLAALEDGHLNEARTDKARRVQEGYHGHTFKINWEMLDQEGSDRLTDLLIDAVAWKNEDEDYKTQERFELTFSRKFEELKKRGMPSNEAAPKASNYALFTIFPRDDEEASDIIHDYLFSGACRDEEDENLLRSFISDEGEESKPDQGLPTDKYDLGPWTDPAYESAKRGKKVIKEMARYRF